MNKKILAAAIAAFLMTPAAFADYPGDANGGANNGTNDDAVDIQSVSVIIPEVALLNMAETIDLVENFVEPTTAGDGLGGSATASSTYAISSNIKNISPVKREITVAVAGSGTGALPEGAQLSVALGNPGNGATAGTAVLKAGQLSDTSVTNIGNIASSTGTIGYTLEADNNAGTGGMIAYTTTAGGDIINLTYTLTND